MPSALEILRADKVALEKLAASVGAKRAREILERAQLELNERLGQAEGLKGPGKDSFTATQLRAVLAQVRAVLTTLKPGLKKAVLDTGGQAAKQAANDAAKYLTQAEQEFRGSTKSLPLDTAALVDRSVAGTESSLLRRLMSDPSDPRRKGILERYGENVVAKFEDTLQQRLVQGAPWDEVRARLVTESTFLQGAPAYWAERIIRTESMYASNRANWQAIREMNGELGGVVKILSATFDSRTHSDSYAVHGQIRRPDEPFHSWFGAYMHPPNRPNDRETVIPHRLAWPIPDNLRWKSDSEIASRWYAEGRKGAVPPRPKMTTVPLDQFGKDDPELEALKPGAVPAPAPPKPKPKKVAVQVPLDLEPKTPPAPKPEPAPPPPPAPEPPKPKPKRITTAERFLDKLIAPASGSNPGGVYEGRDGRQRYVKFYSDDAQAAGEHLANQIYAELGLGEVKSTTFEHEGKLAYASDFIPEAKTLAQAGLTKELAKKALDGFAADVLTANWDAAGLALDNMLVDKKGRVIRIDNGGAFLSRAQAGRKPDSALKKVAEWTGFFDPNVNEGYAELAKAAGVSRAEDLGDTAVKGIEKILKLRKKYGDWGGFVDKYAKTLKGKDREQVVDMLEERTKFLEEKLVALKAPKPPPRSDEPLPPPRPIEAREIVSLNEYSEKAASAKAFLKSDPERTRVLHDFTEVAFVDMNNLLWSARDSIEKIKGDAPTIERIKKLQSLLADAKRQGHVVEGVVYRGIHVEQHVVNEYLNRKVGEVFTWEGFSSTSVKEHIAFSFTSLSSPSEKRVMFRIRQRSAVPIQGVSAIPTESEALLPARTQLRQLAPPVELKRWVDHLGQEVTYYLVDLEEI